MFRKLISFAIATLLTLTASAVDPMNVLGSFVEPTEVAILGYSEKEPCEADGGRWLESICMFRSENTIDVVSVGDEVHLHVITVHTNGHTCAIESLAERVADNVLVVTAPGWGWSEEASEWTEGTCKVTVTYKDENTVSVSNNDWCSNHCGMRGYLEVLRATRQ